MGEAVGRPSSRRALNRPVMPLAGTPKVTGGPVVRPLDVLGRASVNDRVPLERYSMQA